MMKGDEKMSLFQQARQAMYTQRLQKAIYDGNVRDGLLPTGMVCGTINDTPTCKELIDRVIKEAEQAIEGAAAMRIS